MDNHITNALLIALCQSEAYRGVEHFQSLYDEALPRPHVNLKRLLTKFGQGLVMLGQTLEQWGRFEDASSPEEAWS